jgi:hypothetical protein
MTASLEQLMAAIQFEEKKREEKWGSVEEKQHSMAEWLLIIEEELREAKEAWANHKGDGRALEEIMQVATTAVACLRQHHKGNSHKGNSEDVIAMTQMWVTDSEGMMVSIGVAQMPKGNESGVFQIANCSRCNECHLVTVKNIAHFQFRWWGICENTDEPVLFGEPTYG